MTVPNSTPQPDLQQTLAKLQLTALPQSAIRLLELSHDANCGPAEYAAPIEADPGLAGQVLKFVNSSYFGFARKIPSVKAGISLVGVRTIRNFALWNAVFSLVPSPRCGPFDLKCIWQDSLRRAIFARTVARANRLKNVEEIFTAALLQDMAIPLLAKEFPQLYAKLLGARNEGRNRLSSLEQQALGWTHCQAAAELVRRWNLPEEFAALIADHASGSEPGQAASDVGRQIVALSAMLPAAADPLWGECAAWEQCSAALCMAWDAPAELLEEIDREFAEFAPLMKLPTPRKSLAECYQDTLAAT